MKIQLVVNNYLKELVFDKILCINANYSNQEEFISVFKNGLNGKSGDFSINGSISIEDYNILEYTGKTLSDDLKLTKKSINYLLLDNIGDNVDLDYYDVFNKNLSVFDDKIKEKYSFLLLEYPNIVNPRVEISNFNELIKNCYKMIDIDDINIYQDAELQIMLMLNYINNDIDNQYILILNQLDRYLDISQMMYLVEKIQDISNAYVVITQKNFDFYCYSNNIVSHYILTDKEFISVDSIDMDIDIKNNKILTDEEYNVILQNIRNEKIKKTYYEKVSERNILKK